MTVTSKKILIVDDDAKNVFALSAVLRSRGYQCISASGGSEGIAALLANTDIGMVLMDMMMPEMDGYTAIPLIKKNEKIAATPIIAVTAQAMVGDKEKCLESGADAYIAKPIDLDKLLLLLDEFLK
jgi:two-component system, cell cycle response regulator DivK